MAFKMEVPIKVWFYEGFTEAHRTPERKVELNEALRRQGVMCCVGSEPEADCNFALCGSVWHSAHVSPIARAANLPLIHYNWDIYPWQVDGTSPECLNPEIWQPYIEELTDCREVWVPSKCTAVRTQEYTGHRRTHVILSAVKTWQYEPFDGGWVVDVMRKYPDPNRNAVKKVCDQLGIPCIETGAELGWLEYQRTIAGARLLVSGYYEASTGGLSLLEGYALGKTVLLSDSPRMGAVDYFGTAADYFTWDDMNSLRRQIKTLYESNPRSGYRTALCRQWVEKRFSDDAMAAAMAHRLRQLQEIDHNPDAAQE